ALCVKAVQRGSACARRHAPGSATFPHSTSRASRRSPAVCADNLDTTRAWRPTCRRSCRATEPRELGSSCGLGLLLCLSRSLARQRSACARVTRPTQETADELTRRNQLVHTDA